MAVWYHGDTAKRGDFRDQKMDRDSDSDPNAAGPGIYFTADQQQAQGYAYPDGYVYTAEISTRKILKDTTRPSAAKIRKLILSTDAERLEYGLSNWGYEGNVSSRNEALAQAVDSYTRFSETMIDAAAAIYHDFYGRDGANDWARAMVKIGYDAYLHKLPAVDHLIVYNPDVIQVLSETKYVQGNPCKENPVVSVHDLYDTFHGVEPNRIEEARVWVPGDLVLLGPCIDVGYQIRDKRSTKDGRYVHDHKDKVKVYRKARKGEKVSKRYAPGRFPRELMVLGIGIGFTYRDHNGEEIEVRGTRDKRLCTNASGKLLALVDGRGVNYVICGGSMRVRDWIYD
jgi:hypothetical protein